MFYKQKYYILITLILLGFLASGVGNTQAAGIGLMIQPIKVSYELKPGESISDKFSLTNTSEEAVKVETKVEDFIPAAGSPNIQFVGRAEGITTVRDWVTLGEEKSFILQKGENREIPYTIKAPGNAEPGSHFGVAFFKATGLKEEGQLRIGTQVGALIFVTVPGNYLQKGRILEFRGPKFIQKGPVSFSIKFENTGTVHFEPRGSIKITDIFNREVGDVPVEGQVVLPTGVRDLTAQWNISGILLGRYKAEVEIKDGEGNILTAKSIYFYAFPIYYFLYFLLTFVILFYLLKFLRTKLKISVSIKK